MMLIVGCGDLGRRLARQWRAGGRSVTGLVRSPESAAGLAAWGAAPLVADLDRDALPPLPTAGAQVFYFAPPPPHGRTDPRMGRFLAACARDGQPARIVAISTTGVYGDCRGDWVDEQRPANPQVDRARRRWDAEQQLRAWREHRGGELVILRVAGIYGPGKLPLERLRQGLPMIPEHEAPWTNRIHIDDLVQVCLAAMQRAPDGALYNVSDGHPGNMTDYFNRVADLAGLPRPPLVPLAEAEGRLSAGLLSYLGESRRLRNDRMLRELGIELRYPALQLGLPACFAADPAD
jgi:nucleoside-diphosphate-sugar epimerase